MSKLFSPISIRGETFKNRAFVSPMCQYSSDNQDGHPTNWHMVHLGSRAVGGAGLVMFEATAVTPNGRITPWDLGIWDDEHITSYATIADFISSQGAIPGLQLAHAGRKASHDRPWNGGSFLAVEHGGWEPSAPSPIPYTETEPIPKELSVSDIDTLVEAFGEASKRAVAAGIKVLELHFAHGYLVFEFMSPLSNRRQDIYGGSFENRVRFPLQIVDRVRESIPNSMPLFVRISSSEYMPEGWDIESSISFSKLLKDHGVDLVDCSSGGNSPMQTLHPYPGYQVSFSSSIRAESQILTGAVGLITEPQQAEQILLNDSSDVIFLGREFLRKPYWPIQAQSQLDSQAQWATPYHRAAESFSPPTPPIVQP